MTDVIDSVIKLLEDLSFYFNEIYTRFVEFIDRFKK